MTDQEKERVIDKIKKLFKLAENNPSEQEAQSALSMARALMLKYEMEESECTIQDDGKTEGETLKDLADADQFDIGTKRVHNWINILSYTICRYFDVKCYMNTPRRWRYDGHSGQKPSQGTRFVFYGHKDNVKIASWAFQSVISQIKDLSKKYKPSKDAFNCQYHYSDYAIFCVIARQEYCEGVVQGFDRRVYDEKKAEKVQYGEVKCTALAVRHEDIANMYLEKACIKLGSAGKASNSRYGTNSGARSAGMKDSAKVSFTKGGIGGGSSLVRR